MKQLNSKVEEMSNGTFHHDGKVYEFPNTTSDSKGTALVPLNTLEDQEQNSDSDSDQDAHVPPDGGIRAFLVMVGSFLCNGIIFGTINSGGVIFKELKQILENKGVQDPASKASLTLSLAIGMTFLLSMVSGVFTDKFGIRTTTITGGILATLGMTLSSVYYSNEDVLWVTMGIVFGVGASLVYTPSLVILGHYFRKYLGLVNGIVTAGSSIFTIILTMVLKIIIRDHGLQAAFQMLAALMVILIICGIIFKPLIPKREKEETQEKEKETEVDGSMKQTCKNFVGQFINIEIWKNKKYVIWTIAIPSALFGYFVPYVHLVEYASEVLSVNTTSEVQSGQSPYNGSNLESNLLPNNSSNSTQEEDTHSEVLIQCIGVTSLVGRIAFGFIADLPNINRIYLQQISFLCIGIFTMLLTLADALWMFIVLSLGMGLFDGCFISLLGPIAFDIVGSDGASQAIGFLLGLCSFPLTLGPYIAGVLEDRLHSYTIPFLCAGIPPILGCFALFLLKCVKTPKDTNSKC